MMHKSARQLIAKVRCGAEHVNKMEERCIDVRTRKRKMRLTLGPHILTLKVYHVQEPRAEPRA
jgi:hypothetical protein